MLDPRAFAEAAAADDDVDRFAAMTPEERLVVFLELCELTHSIVTERANAEDLLAPTPRSPESEALWMRLVDQARNGRR